MKKSFNQFDKNDFPMDVNIHDSLMPGVAPPKVKISIKAIGGQGKVKDATKSKISEDVKKLKEIEQMADENIRKIAVNKSRRNQWFISVLAVLLVLVVAGIVVYSSVNQRQDNCYIYSYGGRVSTKVNNKKTNMFTSPDIIDTSKSFEFKLDATIEENGSFNMSFEIVAYKQGSKLEKTVPYRLNAELFDWDESNQRAVSKVAINGYSYVHLCSGLNLANNTVGGLTISTFSLKINIYIEAV